ncbi:MAG: hypothetical protein HQL28_01875 [Candidatus Omnitrophica bacterium]|nr:hypothetical protein [Candidatus Omnitrophota bacterium]
MFKQISRFRSIVVILLTLSLSSPGAFARDDDRGGKKGNDRVENRGNNRVEERHYNGGDRHYYQDGHYYKRGWFGLGTIVAALAIGAYIESLPPRHTTVVVQGTQYYHDDRYYYRQVPEGGYVVVTAPAIAEAPYPIPEPSTINIPNRRGGYTSVMLIRSGNGFVGPQGEFYPNYPSVDQLRTVYGN